MGQYTVEFILFFTILFFGIWFVLLKRDSRANVPEEVPFLSTLEVRAVHRKENKESHFINMQFRGMLPIYSATNLSFVVSVSTKDKNGRIYPVLSIIDTFQKPKSTVFQDLTKIGEVYENTGCKNWTTIGTIPTEILQPAYGGRQQLKIHTMLIDDDNPPEAFDEKGIALISCEYSYTFDINGYHEEGEHINESRVLSIKLGVAVAYSDDEFHNEEKNVLNDWISKMINPYNKEKRIQLKSIYDSALKEACKLAKDKNLDYKSISKELYKIGEEAQNYEALDLVHEIMVADEELHPKETEIIRDIAALLGIDDEELDYIRNHKIKEFGKPLSRL
jgi:tellurite resistance protein